MLSCCICKERAHQLHARSRQSFVSAPFPRGGGREGGRMRALAPLSVRGRGGVEAIRRLEETK